MMLTFKYKRRVITRTCGGRKRGFGMAPITKPPLRLTCIRGRKKYLPVGDLLFLVSF